MIPLLLSSDAHYAAVRADLESDAQDLEADSWSSAVDQQYLKKHTKETAKRQDVIYGKCDFIFPVRVRPVSRLSRGSVGADGALKGTLIGPCTLSVTQLESHI